MIRIVVKKGIYAPHVFCDQCGKLIEKARDGLETSDTTHTDDGHSANVFHLHKGVCDRQHQEAFGHQGWSELADHLLDLCANAGLTVEEFKGRAIRREMGQ